MTSIIKEDTNYLEVKINKINIFNEKLCNTIRRLILSEIPVYGFHPDNIDIDINTSILNNCILKHRISSLPIQLLKEKNNAHLNISLLINVLNNDGENRQVTTDDCIVKVNNNIRKYMLPEPPIIICNLKPTQELALHGSASYDKGMTNANYYDVGFSYYWEKDNNFVLTIEGKGQLDCKDIFNKACNVYIEKLKELQNILHEHENIKKNHINVKIIGENHTLIDLLTYDIQQNKNINYASFKLDNLFDNNSILEIITNKTQTVQQVIDKSVKKLLDLFYEIQLK